MKGQVILRLQEAMKSVLITGLHQVINNVQRLLQELVNVMTGRATRHLPVMKTQAEAMTGQVILLLPEVMTPAEVMTDLVILPHPELNHLQAGIILQVLHQEEVRKTVALEILPEVINRRASLEDLILKNKCQHINHIGVLT